METRPLGKTGHRSSLATLGAAGLAKVDREAAGDAVRLMIGRGVNHIDIAPSYGDTLAEQQLAPVLPPIRSSVFLACKTLKRSRVEALAELHASLGRLGTDHFDLYQLHAVNDTHELELALGPDGAIEALIHAKEQGLVRFLGITSHGHQAPAVQLEALRRFPFDTVLLPVNFVLWADSAYRSGLQELLGTAQRSGVGVIAIKALAKRPWGDRQRTSRTWYEPFTDPGEIRSCVHFALSQAVTTLAASSDVSLWPAILDAADSFVPMPEEAQAELAGTASAYQTIF